MSGAESGHRHPSMKEVVPMFSEYVVRAVVADHVQRLRAEAVLDQLARCARSARSVTRTLSRALPVRAGHGRLLRQHPLAPSARPQPSGVAESKEPSAPAHRIGGTAVVLAALGVVFGDIGTSPLYALQTAFSVDHGAVRPTPGDVYGVISLIFWSVTLIVSVKYVMVVLRADNDGEGGVMALAALARRVLPRGSHRVRAVILLGVLGASLFYGDSVITPAISVLSAVEGLEVAAPSLADAVLPIGIAIVAALFLVQRFGTHAVGRFFGPVMVFWFLVLAITGIPEIARRPAVLRALSPTYIG